MWNLRETPFPSPVLITDPSTPTKIKIFGQIECIITHNTLDVNKIEKVSYFIGAIWGKFNWNFTQTLVYVSKKRIGKSDVKSGIDNVQKIGIC